MATEFSAVAIRRDFIEKIEDLRLERGLRSHKATIEDLVTKAHARLPKNAEKVAE
jgi:hypothetical protein